MKLSALEDSFGRFLDSHWKQSETSLFSLVYIRLLLDSDAELDPNELTVLLERQKQLRGESYNNAGFEQFRVSRRKEMDARLSDGTSLSRRGMLNRLQYASMLDTEENDLFYLTEPIFEFAREMNFAPEVLAEVLKSEFKEYLF